MENSPPSAAFDSSDTLPTPTAAPISPASRRKFWIVIGAALIISMALLVWGILDSQTSHPYLAPDFTLTTYDGQTVHMNDLRGKVVVLNFWASWCGPCRSEAPVLEALYSQLKSSDVIFVGVDQADKTEDAQAYLKQYNVTYPTGPDNGIVDAYRVQGLPTTIIVDPNGVVRNTLLAAVELPDLQRRIDAARLPVAGSTTTP